MNGLRYVFVNFGTLRNLYPYSDPSLLQVKSRKKEFIKEISEEKARRRMKEDLNKRMREEEIARVHLSSSYELLYCFGLYVSITITFISGEIPLAMP
jgi:hypothetical protein